MEGEGGCVGINMHAFASETVHTKPRKADMTMDIQAMADT
jgi:hypothetical protein